MLKPKIVSLFSGYGGLDMAVEAVTGGETVAVADIDQGACKILAHRFPDVPNLGDISKVDWSEVKRMLPYQRRDDNDLSNLACLPKDEHTKLHAAEAAKAVMPAEATVDVLTGGFP